LAWVFVSIGSTVLAGIVLFILYRLGRRQVGQAAAAATISGPAPVPALGAEPVASSVPLPSSSPPLIPPLAEPAGEPTVQVDAPLSGGSAAFAPVDASTHDGFPIADYDDLRVAEILPLLPELDADELAEVRAREESGKARATVLARVDELVLSVPGGRAGAPLAVPAAVEAEFPIADYEDLRVAEILPLLGELDADELEVVADREERGANRQTILNRVDALLEAIDARALATEEDGAEAALQPAEATVAKSPTAANSTKGAGKGAGRAATAAPAKSAARATAPAKTAGRAAAAAKSAGRAAAPAKSAGRAATAAPARSAGRAAAAAKSAGGATKATATKSAAKRSGTRPSGPARQATAKATPAKRSATKESPATSGKAAPATKAAAKRAAKATKAPAPAKKASRAAKKS
jgi:hypothetical protein